MTTNNCREYFVDVLTGVLTSTTFAPHELHEDVAPLVEAQSHAASTDATAVALDVAHNLAFRKGLGNTLFATAPVALDAVKAFASEAFTKDNVAIIGSGVSDVVLAELVKKKLSSLPAGSKVGSTTTKYFGGASRVSLHGETSTLFIGFGTTQPSPALSVLAAYLDPTPALKWTERTGPLASVAPSVNVEIVNDSYSDGALFGVLISGADISAVTEAGKLTVKALKDAVEGTVLKTDAFTKAVAKAKFAAASALESGRELSSTILAYKVSVCHLQSTNGYDLKYEGEG